MKINGGMK